MNTDQRAAVRRNLTEAGFTRTEATSDHSGTGQYAETFTHPNGDVVTISWSPRTGTYEPVLPANLRRFLNHKVIIGTTAAPGQTSSAAGYVHDVFRSGPDTVGIRLVEKPGSSTGETVLLPDNMPWAIVADDSSSTYTHIPRHAG